MIAKFGLQFHSKKNTKGPTLQNFPAINVSITIREGGLACKTLTLLGWLQEKKKKERR